jgi:hypothetical protein
MCSRRLLAPFVLSAICIPAGFAAEDEPSRDEGLAVLASVIPPETITSSHVIDSDGFHIAFDRYKQLGEGLKPNGDEFQSVFVSALGSFRAQVVKGVSPTVRNAVSIYHRHSGTPLLTLSDSDGDGQPDALTYSRVDSSGNVTLEVTDYDMDGQADLRLNFAEHHYEVWHADRWYRVEARDGRRGIVVDGRFVELRKDKNRYVVPGP